VRSRTFEVMQCDHAPGSSTIGRDHPAQLQMPMQLPEAHNPKPHTLPFGSLPVRVLMSSRQDSEQSQSPSAAGASDSRTSPSRRRLQPSVIWCFQRYRSAARELELRHGVCPLALDAEQGRVGDQRQHRVDRLHEALVTVGPLPLDDGHRAAKGYSAASGSGSCSSIDDIVACGGECALELSGHYANAETGIPRDARTLEAAMRIEAALADVAVAGPEHRVMA
jgi:hypothetical protein